MKKTKLIALTLSIVMVATMLCACASSPSSSGDANGSVTTTDPAGDAETIKIGFVGPLTGDAAAWGIAQLNAVKVRIDKTNKDGGLLGKQLELSYYDNREDPVESVNAARKLIETDKVVAIIGPNNSACALAMSSVCDDYKVPMIATNTTLEKITVDDDGNVRPNVFRAIMIQQAYVNTIVDYLYNYQGARTVAMLYLLSIDSNIAIVKLFQQEWEKIGGTIVASETTASADDVDFRAQLTKIKDTNPDVIFTPFTYKQIILVAQQARELGITSQFAGCDTWFQVNIPKSAGQQVEGCVAIASLDVNDPVLDPIKEEYMAYFNEMETLNNGGTDPYYGYDAFMMLKAAIEDAGSADSSSIRNALENIKDVQGCVGKLTINPETHNPVRELAIVTIKKQADGTYAYETLGTAYEDVITLKDKK